MSLCDTPPASPIKSLSSPPAPVPPSCGSSHTMPAERTRSSKRGSRGDHGGDRTANPSQAVNISFAPTVTPGTFLDPPAPVDPPVDSMLFPPSPDVPDTPRRNTHTKKKPENHIPRPPNAFILFRSSFIKNQHVSSDVETNHSTLSKIIGLTWQNLPHDEKQIWHAKAKVALEEHKKKFPQYTFKPSQPKTKPAEKRKVREVGPKDLTRCAKIAELLVEGLKGNELETAIAEFDRHHVPQIVTRFEAPITAREYRRSSSAPIEETGHSNPKFLGVSPTGHKLRASSTQPERVSTPESANSVACSSPAPWNEELDTDASSEYFESPSVPQSPAEETVTYPLPETNFDFGSFNFSPSASTTLPPIVDPLSAPSDNVFDLYNPFAQPIMTANIQVPPNEDVFGPCLTIDTSGSYSPYSPTESPISSMPSTPLSTQAICGQMYSSDTGLATALEDYDPSYGYYASSYGDTLAAGYLSGNERVGCYPPPKSEYGYYDKQGMMAYPGGLQAQPPFLASYGM